MIRSRAVRFLLILAALVVLAGATYALWMPWLGWALVKGGPPEHADAVLVLAGDFYGHRIERAAELARQGYVPKVLVSGPRGMYGYYECELAIGYAVKRGYPPAYFLPLPNTALSTEEEAHAVLPEIRKMGIHRLLLVTSDYHTARAGRIFHSAAPDLEIRVVSAPDEYFQPGTWWRTRQSRKIFLMEWSKTVAQWAGM